MFAKAIVEMGGQGSLDVRSAVINEHIKHIVVVVAMRGGGCGRGCHRIYNNKEIRLQMCCRNGECALNLNILVVLAWMIPRIQSTLFGLCLSYSIYVSISGTGSIHWFLDSFISLNQPSCYIHCTEMIRWKYLIPSFEQSLQKKVRGPCQFPSPPSNENDHYRLNGCRRV